MHIAIIGAGGVGCYYGARLVQGGERVTFVARGKHLEMMQEKGLEVIHPDFTFHQSVDACDMKTLLTQPSKTFDAIILLTKAMQTESIAIALSHWCEDHTPYIISLQNGVENEGILAKYLDPKKIIGGLSVKIGAHIMSPGIVHAVGVAQTPLGLWEESADGTAFLTQFVSIMNANHIPTTISPDIRLELWKKLIINNGVNALCALLEKRTGEVIADAHLSKIVLGQMKETAIAAKAASVTIHDHDVIEMFDVIKKFDSIKPSMLVDREHNRPIELDEICGVVIRNCESQGLDAPYTRSVSTLLRSLYHV
ncbi:ketopantoate reductase family protein [Sulfurospirillum sp. 1612]|uniref:ketopantoate reductase family protein n=1 Tax=Sulfurospirillum sp. 1612 TaxID=3094835 RepID=UPI002F92E10A